LDAEGVELLQKMLIFAPNKRITAKQILSDKWFDEIREEMIEQFGNVYPHCGSKQYQLQKFREKQAERNKNKENNQENIDPLNEYDEDYDYNVDKNKKNNDHQFDEDEDYSDDDITGNAEEWNNNNNSNHSLRKKPMDVEDK